MKEQPEKAQKLADEIIRNTSSQLAFSYFQTTEICSLFT